MAWQLEGPGPLQTDHRTEADILNKAERKAVANSWAECSAAPVESVGTTEIMAG
jgi:hypothetical protein